MTELTRAKLITLRDALEALPGVEAVDVLESDDRLDRRALEVTVGPGFTRVPASVLRTLAMHDSGVWDVTPRGDFFVVVAT